MGLAHSCSIAMGDFFAYRHADRVRVVKEFAMQAITNHIV